MLEAPLLLLLPARAQIIFIVNPIAERAKPLGLYSVLLLHVELSLEGLEVSNTE